VTLHLLNLSDEATSLALEALGAFMSKASMCEAVEAATRRGPGSKHQEVLGGLQAVSARGRSGGRLASGRAMYSGPSTSW